MLSCNSASLYNRAVRIKEIKPVSLKRGALKNIAGQPTSHQLRKIMNRIDNTLEKASNPWEQRVTAVSNSPSSSAPLPTTHTSELMHNDIVLIFRENRPPNIRGKWEHGKPAKLKKMKQKERPHIKKHHDNHKHKHKYCPLITEKY